jgi:hypothetical protein
VEITLRASDANTAPFDDLAIRIDLEQVLDPSASPSTLNPQPSTLNPEP